MITSEQSSTPQETTAIFPADLIVWTPEIDRLARNVARWIRLELPGGTVYGQQRNGKTRACIFLANSLCSVLRYEIAVLHWTIPEQNEAKQTEREFIQMMMQQSNCLRVSSRDSEVLRLRLYTHLAELATVAGSMRIVIMIDEAQNLSRLQFGWLIHCFNRLEQLEIYPFFLLVGQPELENTPGSWKEASGMQVLGRFFAQEHRYKGVDCNEIEAVLDAFDEPVQGATCSFLAGPFPAAYSAGWRLKNLAPPIVEALNLVMKQHNILTGLRVPMQYLRSSLLSILYRVVDENIPLEHVNTAMMFGALKDSGFFSVLGYYVDTPTPEESREQLKEAA